MKYHRQTFDKLLRRPAMAVEEISVQDLPPSVAEWYSQPDATEILANYSNGEWAISPSDFEGHMMNLPDGQRICFADEDSLKHSVDGQTLTVFMVENQGVCWWAFAGNADDPPVFCKYNEMSEVWKQVAASFSDFIYGRIFDHLHHFEDGRFHSEITDDVPNSTIEIFDRRFTREVTTQHLEGWDEFRFSRGGQRITISGQMWKISGDSFADFVKLSKDLEPFLDELPV